MLSLIGYNKRLFIAYRKTKYNSRYTKLKLRVSANVVRNCREEIMKNDKKCPLCSGQGWLAVVDKYNMPIQAQCKYCSLKESGIL